MQLNKAILIRRLIRSIPYLLIALLSTKLSLAWRASSGSDFSAHIMSFLSMLGTEFQSPWPSLYPADLIFGAACGGLLRLAVYLKGR
ncbi:MAG: type IV secretory system conjugative DNA transfer family protein, partial [Oscillospiraceae bacterium]|nr:type IV secretory system conjugative DNA transfer family protein [Oscillospiraceae bacterium]